MIESKLTSEDRVFIEQSVVAEENLIRLALEAEDK